VVKLKIGKFLDLIQTVLLVNNDTDIKTVKMFIQIFNQCITMKERDRYWIAIQMISEFSLKQISLDNFVNKEKLKILENNLEQIKNGNKN